MKKSAVMLVSTSELSDGSNAGSMYDCIFRMGGMPWRMFISIGKAIETWAPLSFTTSQAASDIPVMWMNRLSGPMPRLLPMPPVPAARSSRIGRIPNGDRMCAAIWRPILTSDVQAARVGRLPEIDLAAHDEADKIVDANMPARRAAHPGDTGSPGMAPALSK